MKFEHKKRNVGSHFFKNTVRNLFTLATQNMYKKLILRIQNKSQNIMKKVLYRYNKALSSWTTSSAFICSRLTAAQMEVSK